MDSDDSTPFSLTQPLSDGAGYPVSSMASQYHAWVAVAGTSSNMSSNNNGTTLPAHFSPVSPTGHGMYNDHLTMHPSQAAVDMLSARLGQADYGHSSSSDRLSQGDNYHGHGVSDANSRHQASQVDYHDHLVSQDRHLSLDSYHHISSSSSSSSSQQPQDRLVQSDYHSTQQADRLGSGQGDFHVEQQQSRLGQNDYHKVQQADRLGENDYHSAQKQQQDHLGQSDYHSGQQSDRLGQPDYHISSQSDRLGQLDYHGGQNERLNNLGKQDYHGIGNDRLDQQANSYHSGQPGDRGLGVQADFHSAQVDLDSVSMHPDFDRRHLDVSMLPKDLVDSGQRGSAIDYLTSQTSRDTLASLVGLPRELDLSVGQTVASPQRSVSSELASSSYSLEAAALPRDFSSYSQRDLDRVMMSASDVMAGQIPDCSGRNGSIPGVSLHPQDLAGINLTAASRDLVDMASLARSGTSHDDMGRSRDILHRPREVQHALDVLGSVENSTASVDLTLNGGNSTKSSSRSYHSTSRLTSSAKRQGLSSSLPAEIRIQDSLPGINFFPLPTSRDPLNIMVASDPSVVGGSSRLGVTADFTRQTTSEMSRLRRELAPYSEHSVHSMLASVGAVSVPTFKNTVEPPFSVHGDQLICNDVLTSSRERLYEMMKQQQFCDAVLATTLHSIKVHKAVLCSASAYLCGVLSQTCMGKSGGRILTVQFKADIPASSLSAFIDFIYQGRIKVSIKSARDLNVMARCLHMESLKKMSEEMLQLMGLNNVMDLSIPELLLLETLVDKLDKACTAYLPSSALGLHNVDVATDTSFFKISGVDGSSQTDEALASCSSGGTLDLRPGGSSLRLGGLGSLSLAVTGSMNVGGGKKDGDSEPALTASVSAPVSSVCVTGTFSKPHHKKHLASQASQAKVEAAAAMASSLQTASSSSSVSKLSTMSVANPQVHNSGIETESHSSNIAVRSTTPTSRSLTGKQKKRTSATLSSISSASPSPSQVLPGQTARTIHHSYGTRAASRTPTNTLELQGVSKCSQNSVSEVFSCSESETSKLTVSENTFDALSQMAKHRGRTKKGRIAAALSEAFQKSSQCTDLVKLCEGFEGDKNDKGKLSQEDGRQLEFALPCSLPDHMTTASNITVQPFTTTAITEAKRSAPRAYRKRLIQSVVFNQSLLANKQAAEKKASDLMELCTSDLATAIDDDHKGESQLFAIKQQSQEDHDHSAHAEQLRESLHSPFTNKRRKKGKTKRMLLSSPNGNGGVRVRAPPKKRAKMELELEKLMREEMEDEEEEDDAAASGSTADLATDQTGTSASSNGNLSHQQQITSGRLIKMPASRPGKPARWIKNDKLSHLLIELNRKAGSVAEGDCIYICCLCSNQFLVPKRCLSHITMTHKVPEAEVIDNIQVRQREEEEKCPEELSVADNLVCDICGYRSRENTTYYLHYHKYFKHGVALPKGWSVYTCDLCGKELYTKFQLKDHKWTHAEKTPFVCEVCGSGFQSRSNLHSHVLHRHKKERKHSCDRCDRTFKTRTHLAVHERTHTGVRPFSCPENCSYRSTTRGNMRLHLVNRHKISSSLVHDIMLDIKPDVDLSLKSSWQQAPPDYGEKKVISSSKRKSGHGIDGRLKKEREGAEERSLTPDLTANSGKPDMVIDSSAVELFLKSATGEGMCVGKEEKGVDGDELMGPPMAGSSMMLTTDSDGNSSVVTLQAAEPFTTHAGVEMCGETSPAVTFLPPGLETVFHHPQSDLSVASTTATTTIIVPENFLLQHHAHAFQHHHKHHLYHSHPQSHFTSFVVGSAPALQTLNPTDLVVSTTTLNPDSLKGDEVDLGDMGVGVIDGSFVDGTLRQGGLGSTDLNLQPSGASGLQQTVSSSSSQQNNDHIYMQHSPVSPAPSMSPNPMYVAITPTPQPLTPVKQEGEASVSIVGQDPSHQVHPAHQCDTSLLQAYYSGHFYSQGY